MNKDKVLNRYPKAFEEVLKKHGIEWDLDCYAKVIEDGAFSVHGGIHDAYREVSKYEIAGIFTSENKAVRIMHDGYHWIALTYYTSTSEQLIASDKDYLKCIDKAIREIYKES